MAKSDEHGSDSVLHYLRSIDAKLDRLNKLLANFLSAPKKKQAARAGDAGDPAKPIVVVSTEEAAEEYRKMHPDEDVVVIITGVPRAERDS
jgi:hypothetical protein